MDSIKFFLFDLCSKFNLTKNIKIYVLLYFWKKVEKSV